MKEADDGATHTSDQPGGTEPDDTTSDEPRSPSRRSFLTKAGLVAAGVAAGGAAGGVVGATLASQHVTPALQQKMLPHRAEPGFDHVIVLMFENRSFDNILGYLYDDETLPAGSKFDGLNFGDYSCLSPYGDPVPAHVYEGPTDQIFHQPSPDPGEEYPHVNTQLYNTINPPSNAGLFLEQMVAPFNAPPAGTKAQMQGFVTDYVINYMGLKKGDPATALAMRRIMGNFSPEMMPVMTSLARNFAVFDHWHCAVPSQTFCNRSFFHASTSRGFVTNAQNGGFSKWLNEDAAAPTIFNRLEEAGIDWRIYYDELQLVSFTGVLHANVLEKYWKTKHFATMDQFYKDAQDGNLPAYSFIEPRMVYNHNDMHPPFGRFREEDIGEGNELVTNSAFSDVRAGEVLLHQVYGAVRTSASKRGSNAMNTMLLVTFDEHGGLYDHVPPPSAIPPSGNAPGEMGFTFDRLGCRVPAIAISAYTKAGTIINDEMHHAALVRTLSRLYDLDPLTARDTGANDLFNVINLKTPRQPVEWPQTTPAYTPPNPEANSMYPGHPHRHRKLSPPGKGLLGLLLAKYGAPDEEIPDTFEQAYTALHTHGRGLFGADPQ